MTIALSLVAAGLVALVVGGDVLVRGAVALAEKAGVSALVIGVVIVGLGTSMPELVTSIEAALAGAPAIAWGNIAGSNIANSLLILGAAALVQAAQLALELATARVPGRHIRTGFENAGCDGRQGNTELKQGLAIDLNGNLFFRHAAEFHLVDAAGQQVALNLAGDGHQLFNTAVAGNQDGRHRVG